MKSPPSTSLKDRLQARRAELAKQSRETEQPALPRLKGDKFPPPRGPVSALDDLSSDAGTEESAQGVISSSGQPQTSQQHTTTFKIDKDRLAAEFQARITAAQCHGLTKKPVLYVDPPLVPFRPTPEECERLGLPTPSPAATPDPEGGPDKLRQFIESLADQAKQRASSRPGEGSTATEPQEAPSKDKK